jgi:hypothetical protein
VESLAITMTGNVRALQVFGVERIQIIDDRYVPTIVHKAINEMASDEPSTSGDQRVFRSLAHWPLFNLGRPGFKKDAANLDLFNHKPQTYGKQTTGSSGWMGRDRATCT